MVFHIENIGNYTRAWITVNDEILEYVAIRLGSLNHSPR